MKPGRLGSVRLISSQPRTETMEKVQYSMFQFNNSHITMFRIVLTPPTVRHLLQHKKNLHFANTVNVCVSCDSHNNEYSAHTALLYWS